MLNNKGFSIVELMIAIAIMSAIIALGLPSFNTYIANSKLRATAQNIYSGLQNARTEALKRNTTVEFLLTETTPITDNAATAILTPTDANTLITTGKNWMIRTADNVFLEGKVGAEGSNESSNPIQLQFWVDANRNNNPDAGELALSSVKFGGLGNASFTEPDATNTTGPAVLFLTNPVAGACIQNGGAIRCLKILIGNGGQTRLCDPAVTTAGDTRAC